MISQIYFFFLDSFGIGPVFSCGDVQIAELFSGVPCTYVAEVDEAYRGVSDSLVGTDIFRPMGVGD